MSSATGAFRLARLAVRRDRVQLPVWIVVLTLTTAASAASVLGLYDTEAERVQLARSTAASGAAIAFNGLVSGTSEGGMVVSQALLVLLVGAGLMSVFAVTRHTRQNEETGRADLLVATAIGRHALVASTMAVVTTANVVLGAVNAIALVGVGLPVGGSVLTGAAVALTGVAFAAVSLLAAQLAASARAANSIAGLALGVAFALRAAGDMTGDVVGGGVKVVSSWPAWLSPLGWAEQTRPYDEDVWVALVPLLLFSTVVTAAALVLNRRRDLGAGILPEREGPARAASWLTTPLGLAWRLQRTVLIGWTIAMTTVGIGYGALAGEIDEFVGSNDGTREVVEQFAGGEGALVDAYLAACLAMGGLAAAGYTVQALLRLRSEEANGTLEAVLAAGVSRTATVLSHVVVVVVGIVSLLVASGAATGLMHGLNQRAVATQVRRLAVASLAQAPAAFVVGALTLLLFALLPRRARPFAWGAFGAMVLLGQMGRVMGLPQLVLDLSPFTHIPAVPAADFDPVPVLVLLAVTAAVAPAALALFRRRDLAP